MATAVLNTKREEAVMNTYTAVSNPELFIQKQIAAFVGTAAPVLSSFVAAPCSLACSLVPSYYAPIIIATILVRPTNYALEPAWS